MLLLGAAASLGCLLVEATLGQTPSKRSRSKDENRSRMSGGDRVGDILDLLASHEFEEWERRALVAVARNSGSRRRRK